MRQGIIETIVGLFIIVAVVCFVFLAIQVSGLTNYSHTSVYNVTANFNNVGDLKVRAPVTIGGVKIGQVTQIKLDAKTFEAVATFAIDQRYDHIPTDSTANIYTAGLLGSSYISLTPGFSAQNLKSGSQIQNSHSALILQNLIGQLLFSLKGGGDKAKQSASDTAAPAVTVVKG
ncbi:MAG: outer membrane lipid asymmetry maintenance protein MlaD [Gammaproteobacteria bacterium]|nr:outer membrane lipid asymmetry maintenance protein MlaD [Gammaproteobacteria bacterium]MCP4474670.1 outer membrane lipid asymmetry maintenance protein MlaD [Gammaproteobacteria bacterium]